MPQSRLNIYCVPAAKKFERMILSGLLAPGAEEVPLQFWVWFMKSYSSQTVPPLSVGSIVPVPTSNTPQPQAQANAALGIKTAARAAESRRDDFDMIISSHKHGGARSPRTRGYVTMLRREKAAHAATQRKQRNAER